MNETTSKQLALPIRYYSSVLDNDLYAEACSKVPTEKMKDFQTSLIKLLDYVALYTILDSLSTIEKRDVLLKQYPQHYTSSALLANLSIPAATQQLLQEKLERVLLSFT